LALKPPLWSRPRQPYFAAAAGLTLYLEQAQLGMVRVGTWIAPDIRDGKSEAAAMESPGALPLLRSFYRTRVAPRQVQRLAANYARALFLMNRRTRVFAPRGLRREDLNMVALPLLDLQAWLDGETPAPSRFAAARHTLWTLSSSMERTIRLNRMPGNEGIIHPYRAEHLGAGLEIEDLVGADWCDSIPSEVTQWPSFG
jgi:hypothetical protein